MIIDFDHIYEQEEILNTCEHHPSKIMNSIYNDGMQEEVRCNTCSYLIHFDFYDLKLTSISLDVGRLVYILKKDYFIIISYDLDHLQQIKHLPTKLLKFPMDMKDLVESINNKKHLAVIL